MSKTLKKNNKPIKLGNVQVQPSHKSLSSIVNDLVVNVSLPLEKKPIIVGVINHTVDDYQHVEKMSLDEMFDLIKNFETVVAHPAGSKINKITPYSLATALSKAMNNTTQNLKENYKKNTLYESLTGGSTNRPEIILMSDFLPLFEKSSTSGGTNFDLARDSSSQSTNALQFFETQVFIRMMRHYNVRHMAATLKKIDSVKKEMISRKTSFISSINKLDETIKVIYELMVNLEKLKSHFDLRDTAHDINIDNVLKDYQNLFASNTNIASTKSFINATDFNIVDVMKSFGYKSSHIKELYTSSKIWLLMMSEMKIVFESQSSDLIDKSTKIQHDDVDPIKIFIKKTVDSHFTFNPHHPNLLSLNSLFEIRPENTLKDVKHIDTAFLNLYENSKFKSKEIRMAAISNLISKEYRYSRGLAQHDVQQILSTHYNYTVRDGRNNNVFDRIIGNVGSNITDFSRVVDNSLISVAQQQPDKKTTVLPFELNYVDGTNGMPLAGGDYYVDNTLRILDNDTFNTNNLENLHDLTTNAYVQFGSIVNGFNLLIDDYDLTKSPATDYSKIISNPRNLLFEITNIVINEHGEKRSVALSDPVTSIFVLAQSDSFLKSRLFLYVMNKAIRSTKLTSGQIPGVFPKNDSNPSTNVLITEIIKNIKKNTSQHPVKTAKIDNTISLDSLENILKYDKSKIMLAVESLMLNILTEFRTKKSSAISDDGITLFSGVPDVAVMMAVFDLIVEVFDKYSGQRFINNFHKKGNDHFGIDVSLKNLHASLKITNDMLTQEIRINRHLVLATLNTLKKISNSSGNVLNFISNKKVNHYLKEISSLFDDKDKLRLLLSEQQVLLLGSHIADIRQLLKQETITPMIDDLDYDGKLEADDEVAILDDSVITPRTRNVIYGLFSTSKFSSKYSNDQRIVTVGLPLGFTHKLKQKSNFKIDRVATTKQHDIIQICIYKTDMENSSIVFKPIKYPFELSRFPVRNDAFFKSIDHTSNKKSFTLLDVIAAVPTRDFSKSINSSQIEYLKASTGELQAFNDDSYSFLTKKQKNDLYTNHVISYLLEVYLNVMSGMSVAEHHFSLSESAQLVDHELTNLFSQHMLHTIASHNANKPATNIHQTVHSDNILFSSSNSKHTKEKEDNSPSNKFDDQFIKTLLNTTIPSISTILSKIPSKKIPLAYHTAATISSFTKMPTPLSNTLAFSKKVVQPKQFDRVFNLIVEPDDFEIDYNKTMKTQSGKIEFDQLIKKGEIVEVQKQTSSGNDNSSHVNKYKFRNHSKSANGLLFEKYFVAVETLDEGE